QRSLPISCNECTLNSDQSVLMALYTSSNICSEGYLRPLTSRPGRPGRGGGIIVAAAPKLVNRQRGQSRRGLRGSDCPPSHSIASGDIGDCEQMMENYEPIMSFGEDDAEIYDAEPDVSQRGDTLATVSFLEQLAGGGPA